MCICDWACNYQSCESINIATFHYHNFIFHTGPAEEVQLFWFWPVQFLNQARASRRLVRAWFLKIAYVQTSVCVFVCVSTSKAVNN